MNHSSSPSSCCLLLMQLGSFWGRPLVSCRLLDTTLPLALAMLPLPRTQAQCLQHRARQSGGMGQASWPPEDQPCSAATRSFVHCGCAVSLPVACPVPPLSRAHTAPLSSFPPFYHIHLLKRRCGLLCVTQCIIFPKRLYLQVLIYCKVSWI